MPRKKTKSELLEIKNKTEDTVGHFLGFFFLNKEGMKATQDKIRINSKANFNYILLTIFSVLVIVFGMIIDSTAVVIGGMLISPLFWPILGFSIGVVSGSARMVTNSFFVLFKSLLLIIGISVIIGIFVPQHILETNEFIARTSPTIYDLLIGFIAGFLGAYIVAHPKISSSFGGVVVAAALVPPIAVMGIALSKGEFDAFGSAFLLTIASLVSMTFSASLLFYIGRIRAKKGKTFFTKNNIGWFAFALVIVVTPLIFLTNQIVNQSKRESIVTAIALEQFPDASIISAVISEKNDIVSVKLIIQKKGEAPDHQIKAVADVIAHEFKQSIILDLRTVPVLEKREIVTYP